MRWFKRDVWKVGITIAGILLLLVLMAWIPVSAAGAHEGASDFAELGTIIVQATPTVDATVTALSKEQLTQQVTQQQHTWGNWLWNFGATILSTLSLALAGVLGFFRYLRDQRIEREKQREDRQAEREKRSEERFQSVVEGLGSASPATQVGAAIMLHTFLQSGYEQFYRQAFDLAVANLRLRHVDPDKSEPLDSLSQALIIAFKESFPLARARTQMVDIRSLDATGIQLDNAYMREAHLEVVWMPQASMRGVKLSDANLNWANLNWANLIGADLIGADLSDSRLREANLSRADLSDANLSRAKLSGANLSDANLSEVPLSTVSLSLSDANLSEVPSSTVSLSKRPRIHNDTASRLFSGADLSGADLSRANLSRANLSGTSLEDALSLKDTDLRGVKGLTKEQLAACKAKGAIIDEDLATNSSQSTVATPPSSQSNDAQTPLAPPAQESLPTPDTGGSSTTSSKLGPGS